MPADPFLVAFGRRIAARRQARSWTQEVLADRADLTGKYVSEIERGVTNPSLTVLRKLAEGFGTTLAVLLDDEDDVGRQLAAVVAGRAQHEQKAALRIVLALLAEQ